MVITKEMIENLPLSQYPEDYDNVEIITSQIIKEFNEEADKIDMEYANKSNFPTKYSAYV